MAHPDPNRSGSEKGQREHTGPNSEATDAGLQRRHSQNLHGEGPTAGQDRGGDRSAASRPPGADTRVGDIDRREGLVSPTERSDQGGPLQGDLDRDSGAGAAGGRDTSGGTQRGAGSFGIGSGSPAGNTGQRPDAGEQGRRER